MGIVASPVESVRQGRPAAISWQQILREAIRNPAELCQWLDLPPALAAEAQRAASDFPLFAPRGYVSRIRRGDVDDPLLRQILPRAPEGDSAAGFTSDPVGDHGSTLTPGLLHKYHGRVLMVTTGACAVHCRYCFRRHFPYSEGPRAIDDWRPALARIAADPSIQEVILSGGDPLMLVDEQLAELSRRLAEIPHVRRLRVHTRLPIMIPERITDELIDWLRGTRLTPIMVVHANHRAELDLSVSEALARLADAGIPLLNQAVLLAGVNDSVAALADLCERLVELRVMPYYLHQLDRVAGAAHFEVPEAEGRRLMEALRRRLPGYAVPRYVREEPGQPHKLVLA